MKKTIMLFTFILLVSATALAATTVKIDMKDSFKDGETPSFTYEITFSDNMVTFVPQIDCSGNMPVAFLEEQLATTSPFKGTYYGVKIDDRYIEPQECVASVRILSKDGIKAEKKFKVMAKPSMDFSLVTCQDSACKVQRATFVKDGTVYVSFISSAAPAASGVIVYPDGQSVPSTIPGSFIANQAGKYKIEISASKEGLKPYSSIAEVVVLDAEKAKEIPYAPWSTKAGQPVQRPVYESGATAGATEEATPSSGHGCSFIPNP